RVQNPSEQAPHFEWHIESCGTRGFAGPIDPHKTSAYSGNATEGEGATDRRVRATARPNSWLVAGRSGPGASKLPEHHSAASKTCRFCSLGSGRRPGIGRDGDRTPGPAEPEFGARASGPVGG